MKKNIVIAMSAALLISSCTSYTGTGAYLGGSLGSILGSAIGGIAGGPRGSDIGTIIGATTGAIVGAAAGDAAEQSERRQQHEYLSQRNQRIQASKQHGSSTRSGSDDTYQTDTTPYQIDPTQMIDESNSGDDRIDFDFGNDSTDTQLPSYVETEEASQPQQNLELRNVVFSDSSHDGTLSGNETGTVVFELFNHSGAAVTDVVPTVQAEKKNSGIYISPSIRVESIAPGRGIRYTATVKADRRIKDGTVKLYVSAMKNGSHMSNTTVVDIPTRRK